LLTPEQFSGVVEEIAGDGAPDRAGQRDAVTETALGAVPRLKVGDRVMGVTRFGAFAEQVVLPAHQVKALPEGWSFEQGAAFLVQVEELPPAQRSTTHLLYFTIIFGIHV
jgi:NADPH:quinone reductase-like Zn-dependent oxidoreductase